MSHHQASPISLPGIIIFEVDTVGSAETKKALVLVRQNIRGCIIRRTQGKIAKRNINDSRRTANRMVLEKTRHSSNIYHGSRIHSGMRRSEGRSMDATIPGRIEYQEPVSNLNYGQRRIIQFGQDSEVPPTQSTHRIPLPLSPTAGQTKEVNHEHHPREGQPIRYPDETPPDKLSQSLEEFMALADGSREWGLEERVNWDWLDNEMLE